MKKSIAILLVLLLLAAMTACAGPAPTTTPGKTEPDATTVPTTTVPHTTAAPTTPPTTAPQTVENPFVGETVNNVYTNAFLGITCQLDETWTVFDKDQLAQLAGITSDLLDNDAVADAIEKGTVVTAFYAQAQNGQVNMNITLERLNLVNGILMDEESYAKLSKEQLPAALANAGFENVTAETAKLQFAGEERHGVKVHATVQGVDIYESIVCIKNGNYMAGVVVCSVGTDTTDSLLALFQKLEA